MIDCVLIKPGVFMMGMPQAEIDEILSSRIVGSMPGKNTRAVDDFYRDCGPQHQVQLTRAFYLGVAKSRRGNIEN